MPSPHPKFAWIKAVQSDRRFSLGHKAVLRDVAYNSVSCGQDQFAVRQTTVARRVGCSVPTVKRAFARARDLGYLTIVRERTRGRTHHGGDRYALVMPGCPITEMHATPRAEIGINLTRNRDQKPAEIGINFPQKPARDLRKHRPLGSFPGSVEGSRPPACPDHPGGPHHNQPCRRCGDVRRWHANRPTPCPERYEREPFTEASPQGIAAALAAMPAKFRPKAYTR